MMNLRRLDSLHSQTHASKTDAHKAAVETGKFTELVRAKRVKWLSPKKVFLLKNTLQDAPVPVSSWMFMPKNEVASDKGMKMKARKVTRPTEFPCWIDFLDSCRERFPTLSVMVSRTNHDIRISTGHLASVQSARYHPGNSRSEGEFVGPHSSKSLDRLLLIIQSDPSASDSSI